MKLSYEWLKEYVKINVTPEKLADGLTMSGSEVESIEKVSEDSVMSLEITSNRPDCLNIIGLAREASAVFDTPLKMPETKISKGAFGKGPAIKVSVKDKKLCPLYTARVITGVSVKEASGKTKKRITTIGMRDISGVVDVTNFCLMESGQPLHAFDLDKISGAKIIVRTAERGEKIVTIDDVERELEAGMLVIADEAGPIAIAGVMGGKRAEVTERTKNILLESAYFDPASVRRTSRKTGLSSDSSYRFERGVDKSYIKNASDRASSLIINEAGGKICELYVEGKLVPEKVSVKINTDRVNGILGASINEKEIRRILKRLGMKISPAAGKNIKVAVPSFREDIKKEIDLVEEIARVYGYDKISPTVRRQVVQFQRKSAPRLKIEKLSSALASMGLNEIMTYSLTSESAAKKFPSISEEPVCLVNPLSEEQKALTTNLMDGMLRAFSRNISRKNKDLGFFEIGKIYKKGTGKEKYDEIPTLCVGMTGILRRSWLDGERKTGFFDLKGVVEEALSALRVVPTLVPFDMDEMAVSARVTLSGEAKPIGVIGELKSSFLKEYDIAQPVYICQIELDKVNDKAVLETRYKQVPRFPSSSRDISVLCPEALSAGEIFRVIYAAGGDIIKEAELVDMYKGEKIDSGKKALTYSIKYGLDTRTLTEEEITGAHSAIKTALAGELGVTFR